MKIELKVELDTENEKDQELLAKLVVILESYQEDDEE